MLFTEFSLDSRLLRNLQAIGFKETTPIQTAAIPAAMEGKDVLGSAETGTGKTAAFLLPILQRLLRSPKSRTPRALILVPTRELALQVTEHAGQLGRGLPISVVTIYGGVGIGPQRGELKRGVDVVVATPGRLLDHMSRGDINFASLEVLVLDEGDRMLDIGFLPDIRRIVRTLPRNRQTMLFSATLKPILELSRELTRDPVRVEVERTATPEMIDQSLVPVAEHRKFDLLQHLLAGPEWQSVLVFARTKHRADRLAEKLERADVKATVIHGNRSQSQRVAALESFRRGRSRVLVATDIAARGLDVEGISHVVNYDVPMQPEDYVHRVGRTGRMHVAGAAFTMVTPQDEAMITRIQRMVSRKLTRVHVEGVGLTALVAPEPKAQTGRRFATARGRRPPAGPRWPRRR